MGRRLIWGWMLGVCCLVVAPGDLVACGQASPATMCWGNLRQLDDAVATWALEKKVAAKAVPQIDDLVGPDKYVRVLPQCPIGGTYTLHTSEDPVECSIHGTSAAFKRIQRGQIQVSWERRAMGSLFLVCAVGLFLSFSGRVCSGKLCQPVSACMPAILLLATIVLMATRPDFASNASIRFSGMLTLVFVARALCLPRRSQRIVGWVVGSLVFGAYLLSGLVR